ncbi:MAG TPA: 30S ribosomal protein S12 methylthiotransferase RimO [Planctomycetota bacterium]|nr:30S ribosomal protein S12 methylthiotransferase RimO [Planctomycetota bacterium]
MGQAKGKQHNKSKKAGHRPAPGGFTAKSPPVVSMVSLGCSKNTVDSERILGQLAGSGFLIAEDLRLADAILVNTCGFIDESRQETQAVLAEMARLKKSGKAQAVVALGCMVERIARGPELEKYLTPADHRIGFNDYPQIPQLLGKMLRFDLPSGGGAAAVAAGEAASTGTAAPTANMAARGGYSLFWSQPRLRIGAAHSAYLKISEGCSNPCAFCSIPSMRGKLASRGIAEIVAEARQLKQSGVFEYNLIAQDSTGFGRDRTPDRSSQLKELLTALAAETGSEAWIRLFYAYPRWLDLDVIDLLASGDPFCPYIDMPLQHHSDRILRDMRRMVTQADQLHILDEIAKRMPKGALRTTFIVGYPGETDAEFTELLNFVKEGRFTHVGVFTYSTEPGTPAAREADSVPMADKLARRQAIMAAQREIATKRMQSMVGQTLEVLVDGLSDGRRAHGHAESLPMSYELPIAGQAPELQSQEAWWLARTKLDGPEVDGNVYLPADLPLEPGDRLPVKIVKALEYDLVGEAVEVPTQGA